MMTGRLYIDGKDAYRQWGVYVTSGGWNELIAYPPLKSVVFNDWHEEDGIEADLSEPVLNTREVSLTFAISDVFSRFIDFLAQLSDRAYHDFDCAHIGRRYTLRLTQMPNLSHAQTLGFATIKLCNDFPMQGYQYQAPSSKMARHEDYLIDGIPFTNYGCRILQGSLTEVMKTADVKPNMLRNIPTQTGAIYDNSAVTFKSKDVKLTCLMRAESIGELWRNYDALLYDLIRPDERHLTVSALEQEYPCHYKSASVIEFYPDDKVWLKFTLTLTFTHSFRLGGYDFILATESGECVITEDSVAPALVLIRTNK